MWKLVFFVFGGAVLSYCIYYGKIPSTSHWNFPGISEVRDHYDTLQTHNENAILKIKIQKLEFKLARYEEKSTTKNEPSDASRGIASVANKLDLFPEGKSIPDKVMQDVYHWSPVKLHSLAVKEYNLKNYLAAAQYGMTLINEDPAYELINDEFHFQMGIAGVESNYYLAESLVIFEQLIKKYPTSPYLVKAKLWRGLVYHRMNNQTEFLAMLSEFKQKYRNTKEWSILKNIYERGLASSPKTTP